jgi:hypothetical protein
VGEGPALAGGMPEEQQRALPFLAARPSARHQCGYSQCLLLTQCGVTQQRSLLRPAPASRQRVQGVGKPPRLNPIKAVKRALKGQ